GSVITLVLGLSLMLEGAASARVRPGSRPTARHRHSARAKGEHLVAHRRGVKRSHARGTRHGARALPAAPEASSAPEVAFVTLTTATKGTSFYVDGRRVGTGSTVNESL